MTATVLRHRHNGRLRLFAWHRHPAAPLAESELLAPQAPEESRELTPARAALFAGEFSGRGLHPYPPLDRAEKWLLPPRVMPQRRTGEMSPADAAAFADDFRGLAEPEVFTAAQPCDPDETMVWDAPPHLRSEPAISSLCPRPFAPRPYVPDLGADIADLPLFRFTAGTFMRYHCTECRCGTKVGGETWQARLAGGVEHLIGCGYSVPDFGLGVAA
jgi:hypothetical protein